MRQQEQQEKIMRGEYLDLTVREFVELGGVAKTPERVRSDKAYIKRLKAQNENKEQFTSVSDKECSQVFKTLTLPQAGTLLAMFAFMELGESGFLVEGKKKLTLKEFAGLLKKPVRTIQNNISELVALGYVHQHREGRNVYYSVNTKLATRGERTGEGFFTKVYITKLREALKVMTVQEAGLLFFMIPHFNSRAYVLCENPYEYDLSKIELWNRERLAEACGLSLVQVKRLVSSMMKKGVLIGIKTCRTAIVLSPKLVSRQARKVTIEEVQAIIENELNRTDKMAW